MRSQWFSRQSRRHRPSRSSSRRQRTRSVPVSSPPWRGRAATLSDCPPSTPSLLASASHFCARLFRVSAGWRVMANVDNPASDRELGEVQAVAGTLGLEVARLEIRREEDIARAFEELKGRAEAL